MFNNRLHWSAIALKPQKGEVTNTDYLIIVAPVSVLDMIGRK